MTNVRRALKGAVIAVALVGTAIGTTGTASAQGGYYNNDPYAGDFNNGQDGYYNNDPL